MWLCHNDTSKRSNRITYVINLYLRVWARVPVWRQHVTGLGYSWPGPMPLYTTLSHWLLFSDGIYRWHQCYCFAFALPLSLLCRHHSLLPFDALVDSIVLCRLQPWLSIDCVCLPSIIRFCSSFYYTSKYKWRMCTALCTVQHIHSRHKSHTQHVLHTHGSHITHAIQKCQFQRVAFQFVCVRTAYACK